MIYFETNSFDLSCYLLLIIQFDLFANRKIIFQSDCFQFHLYLKERLELIVKICLIIVLKYFIFQSKQNVEYH